MSLNLATLLRDAAQATPTAPLITLGDTTLNYAQVHGMAQRFAGALRQLGVHRGQHIALMLPNVPQFTIAYFGAHMVGCPVVPLNVLLTADEVAYHLDDADAVVLVAWEGFAEAALGGAARVAHTHHVIVARPGPAPEGAVAAGHVAVHDFATVVRGAEPVAEPEATMPDDTAVILYTSGTTGRPKGAELTHFNLLYNAEYVERTLFAPVSAIRALVCLPLFHSFGQTVLQNATVSSGGHMVLLPRFDPQSALGLIQKHAITVFAGVPTMYFALLHADAAPFDTKSLEFCVSGGAAMPVEVMTAFDRKYGVNVLEGYGLSETSPVASFNRHDRPKKPGSIGLPIPRVAFRLEDASGAVITASGEAGEIAIKGPNVMKGYYKRPEATAEAIQGGWFKTGDVATRDDDGYYFIVDRKKDMVIRGGFNVYPREIEEILYAHPAIGEAAVIGVPHDSHGEEVKAVVAFKPGHTATEAELIEYCKTRLAAYKYPRLVEIRDALPKGPTGKILKRELRG